MYCAVGTRLLFGYQARSFSQPSTLIYNSSYHRHSGQFGTINNFRLGRLPSVPVEWNEINAAWGQTVLLLHALANKMGLKFQRYLQYHTLFIYDPEEDRQTQVPVNSVSFFQIPSCPLWQPLLFGVPHGQIQGERSNTNHGALTLSVRALVTLGIQETKLGLCECGVQESWRSQLLRCGNISLHILYEATGAASQQR